jgi:DeoR/GlpR family transcriptional regulator of sugar metabolism
VLAEERRQGILKLIQQEGAARTNDLARIFSVSDQTIRRDLLELEELGFIRKGYGGGVLVNWSGATYGDRAIVRRAEKQGIAHHACASIRDGMTVALGPGTTTEEIAKQIDGRDITVVTNSLAVARAITSAATHVLLTGGRYRPASELVSGELAVRTLSDVFVDVSFIGVSGIEADAGYTVTEPDEAMVLRQFIRIAKRAVIVADSSKFSRLAKASVAPLEVVHALITDEAAPQEFLRLLRARGVECTVVTCEKGTGA